MTIRYKTRDLSYAIEYIRIHLRDKYFVSAYKSNGEYIMQISGLEEVNEVAEQTEPQIDALKKRVDCIAYTVERIVEQTERKESE